MKFRFFPHALAPVTLAAAYLASNEVQHGMAWWLFTLLSLGVVRAITIGRLSWFYTFMAVFFFLGCWAKVAVHHIFDYPYIEPSGNFAGGDEAWREYYWTAGLIGAALIAARLLLTLIDAVGRPPVRVLHETPVSRAGWVRLVGVGMVFYVINNVAAFFVTGVDARVALPFGLNAPLAFMALIGFAVVTSALVDRDIVARRKLDTPALVALLLVTSIASVSMASRAAVAMQAVPILIAATLVQRQVAAPGSRVSVRPFLLFGLTILVVLVVVSIYRINVFSGSSTANTELVGFFALESAMLVVDRWIGAEALMVAVSEPSRSMTLFWQLMGEDPVLGPDASYQVLAGSKYEFLQGLTFLTLPGYFGVIGLSGSDGFIAFATFVTMMAGVLFERVVHRLLHGRTVCTALISAAIANALTQLSFPRLLIPFIGQMFVLVLVLSFAARPRGKARPVPASAPVVPAMNPSSATSPP